MGWLLIFLLAAIGIFVFAWAYRCRLDVLSGRWIMRETA
jgi:hypothetical protein